MDEAGTILPGEDRELPIKAYNMLSEVVETLEVLDDKELTNEVREA